MINRLARTLLLALPFSACATGSSPPLATVESVDLTRYQGKWYEIARLPQSFEDGCVGVTAEYTIRPDGKVDVLNSCYKNSFTGELKKARGIAHAVDSTNSKLLVSFFWPFYGDYWILELGTNYDYAVVGSPNRKYLWILSRTATFNDGLYQAILDRRKAEGFDITKLIKTPQQ